MNINANKKKSGPIGMKYSQKPSKIYIPNNMVHTIKRNWSISRVMYGQKKSG